MNIDDVIHLIVTRSVRYWKLKKMDVPDVILQNEEHMMKESVQSFLDLFKMKVNAKLKQEIEDFQNSCACWSCLHRSSIEDFDEEYTCDKGNPIKEIMNGTKEEIKVGCVDFAPGGAGMPMDFYTDGIKEAKKIYTPETALEAMKTFAEFCLKQDKTLI